MMSFRIFKIDAQQEGSGFKSLGRSVRNLHPLTVQRHAYVIYYAYFSTSPQPHSELVTSAHPATQGEKLKMLDGL